MNQTLQKELSLVDVFCLASGAMISSGLFILPGLAFSKAGPAVFISYFIAGCFALIGILSMIELATALPKTGGDYFFISKSLGPFIGIISGFLSWTAISLKSAFAIFGISEMLFSTTSINISFSSFLLTLLFVLLNILGTKKVSRYEIFMVMLLFLLIFIFTGISFTRMNPYHFIPFIPKGIGAIFSTAGFVFVSFGGLLNILTVSEEIKNPKKNIPLGIIMAVSLVTIIYSLVLLAIIGVMPGIQLTKSLTPVSDAGFVVMGYPGYLLLSGAALLAFITTGLAGILSASRYLVGLSQDHLLPAPIGVVSPKFKTPVWSIALTGLFILICLQLNLEILVKSASMVILLSYFLSSIAVVVLREGKIKNYRPTFKTPFYPCPQLISMILFLLLIVDMGIIVLKFSVGFIIFAIVAYISFGRKNSKKEYALIHLIERIANRTLTKHILESELREIVRQRDEITTDRFDCLIKDSPLLDFKDSIDYSELFRKTSLVLAPILEFSENEIYSLLQEREEQSSTSITPFVAIPHILIPPEKNFSLVMVRCVAGIYFSNVYPSVKAVFILAGSLEERNFHLQAISAVAQIIQNPDFEKRWLQARDTDQLKDVVLLSKRKRFE